MALKIDTYLGYDVFGEEPNWITPVPQEFTHDYDFSRNIGVGVSFSQFEETAVRLNGEWLFQSKADIQQFKDFFDDKIGMLGDFWIPTWQSDLVVTAAIDATDAQLTIEDIGYADSWLNNDVYGRHIAIIFPDGTHVYRKIQGAPSSTIVTLGAAVGKACGLEDLQSLLVSFLGFVRFDQDKMEMEYETPSVARCPLRFKTISDEMTTPATTTSSSSTTTTTTNTQSTTSSSTSSTTTTTIPPDWESYFDDSCWVSDVYEEPGDEGTWDDENQEWVSAHWVDGGDEWDELSLSVIGAWAEGYRPSKIRLFLDTAPGEVWVGLYHFDGEGFDTIAVGPAYVSAASVNITFRGYDIASLFIYTYGNTGTFRVSNIEFFS